MLTDHNLYANKDLFDIVKKAAKAGVSIVQYRDDIIPINQYTQNAKKLKKILSEYNIPLIISNRIEAVIPSDADGIHLENGHETVVETRNYLGLSYIIGFSVHFPKNIKITNSLPLNYIATGPVFHTTTKEYNHQKWGVENIKNSIQNSIHPLVAVGGVNHQNIHKLKGSGIKCIASVSEILHHYNKPQKLLDIIREIENL